MRANNTRASPNAFRSLATTPRSAKTQNTDIDDDNILPVGFAIHFKVMGRVSITMFLCEERQREYCFHRDHGEGVTDQN